MRRATAVILGTITGTALLVGAKVGNAATGTSDADGGEATSAAVIGGTTAESPAPATPKPSAKPTPSPSRTGPTTKPTPSAGKTTSKPPAPTGPKDGTYTAKAAVKSGRFGTLSMTVTIAGHKVTAISASEDGGETNCYHNACPKLKSEALSAQNANIATVSGATYTSQAFKSAMSAVLSSAGK